MTQPERPRCAYVHPDGTPCRADARAGSPFCHVHAPRHSAPPRETARVWLAADDADGAADHFAAALATLQAQVNGDDPQRWSVEAQIALLGQLQELFRALLAIKLSQGRTLEALQIARWLSDSVTRLIRCQSAVAKEGKGELRAWFDAALERVQRDSESA